MYKNILQITSSKVKHILLTVQSEERIDICSPQVMYVIILIINLNKCIIPSLFLCFLIFYLIKQVNNCYFINLLSEEDRY